MSKPIIALYLISCVGLLVFALGPVYLVVDQPAPHSIPTLHAGIWLASGYITLGTAMLALKLGDRFTFKRARI